MFFVLKFKELKISLAEFCRFYSVERIGKASNLKLKFLVIKEKIFKYIILQIRFMAFVE